MKRFLISGLLVTALMVGGWVVNAATANFAGTWVLDKSKSQLPRQLENVESDTMTVTQDAQQLTVVHQIVGGGGFGGRRNGGSEGGDQGGGRNRRSQTGDQGSSSGQDRQGGGRGRGGFGGMQTAVYRLDGTETKMEASEGRGGAASFKAQLKNNGNVLELTNTRTFNMQGNEMTRTTTERWELSDGGKTLKVKRTSEGRQGPQESTLVFTRQ